MKLSDENTILSEVTKKQRSILNTSDIDREACAHHMEVQGAVYTTITTTRHEVPFGYPLI